jgi:hypothetical protein
LQEFSIDKQGDYFWSLSTLIEIFAFESFASLEFQHCEHSNALSKHFLFGADMQPICKKDHIRT